MKNSSPTSPAFWLAYAPLTHILRFAFRVLAPRWRVTGRKNFPVRGTAILAPNHISDCDPPFVALSVYRPLWFMAKRELFEIPILGKLISFAQSFPVDRDAPDRAALKRAEELLKSGQVVVVFPEGHLSQDGELQPLLPGALMLALRAKVPIIPVGIAGTNQVLPFSHVVAKPTLKPVHVHFGAPISFDDLQELSSREQRRVGAERLDNALRQAISVARKS